MVDTFYSRAIDYRGAYGRFFGGESVGLSDFNLFNVWSIVFLSSFYV